MHDLSLVAADHTSIIKLGAWKFLGNFTAVDLIAATTNALNGALLARRPDHCRDFTVVGIVLMALLGGIGGGVTRDVLVNQVPAAFINPAYVALCLAAGIVGYVIPFKKGQLFREGHFQLLTSFSLPWYAVAGVQKGVAVGLPLLAVLILAVIGPTAGRFYIDLASGVSPKQFIRSEWFVGTALLTGAVWIVAYAAGLGTWPAAGIAVVVGFVFRHLALYRGWEEPLANEPTGVYQHDDGRPLLGRKLKGKSHRELCELGLVVAGRERGSAEPSEPGPH